MGFALVFGGGSAVQWATPDKSAFPPVKVSRDPARPRVDGQSVMLLTQPKPLN